MKRICEKRLWSIFDLVDLPENGTRALHHQALRRASGGWYSSPTGGVARPGPSRRSWGTEARTIIPSSKPRPGARRSCCRWPAPGGNMALDGGQEWRCRWKKVSWSKCCSRVFRRPPRRGSAVVQRADTCSWARRGRGDRQWLTSTGGGHHRLAEEDRSSRAGARLARTGRGWRRRWRAARSISSWYWAGQPCRRKRGRLPDVLQPSVIGPELMVRPLALPLTLDPPRRGDASGGWSNQRRPANAKQRHIPHFRPRSERAAPTISVVSPTRDHLVDKMALPCLRDAIEIHDLFSVERYTVSRVLCLTQRQKIVPSASPSLPAPWTQSTGPGRTQQQERMRSTSGRIVSKLKKNVIRNIDVGHRSATTGLPTSCLPNVSLCR